MSIQLAMCLNKKKARMMTPIKHKNKKMKIKYCYKRNNKEAKNELDKC